MRHVDRCRFFRSNGRQHSFLLFTSVILILSMLIGCGPCTEDLEAVEYTPLAEGDWGPQSKGWIRSLWRSSIIMRLNWRPSMGCW